MSKWNGKFVGLTAAIALAVGVLGTGVASARSATAASSEERALQNDEQSAYEQVDSIPMLTRPYSWHRIDDNSVIVWTNPFQAYLLELSYPAYDMKWVEHIGLTSTASRVYAKFDAVQVRGFRYPIHAIFKMSREEARNLERDS
jgi:hypothetical protein